MKNPIIYSLSHPITNEIRYIGKTRNALYKRLSGHWRDKNESYKTNWIKSLKKENLKPIISIIEECTDENWVEREKYWIDFYRNQGVKLTNILDGGEGLSFGYKHSPEAIEKIREAAKRPNSGKFKKGNKWHPKMAEGNWKKILQYSLEGEFIQEWKGIINASQALQINKNSISFCVKGKIKRAGQYQWKYFSENYPLKINEYNPKRRKNV